MVQETGEPDEWAGPAARPAAEDPATRRHEKTKDRAFAFAIVAGLIFIAGGIYVATLGPTGVLFGIVMFLLGAMMGIAAILGFLYRSKARRILALHPWRVAPVTILARPAPGKRGRLIVETTDQSKVPIGITGVSDEFVHGIERGRAIEYAGDLSSSGMLFARIPGGEFVYVAMISSRAVRGEQE